MSYNTHFFFVKTTLLSLQINVTLCKLRLLLRKNLLKQNRKHMKTKIEPTRLFPVLVALSLSRVIRRFISPPIIDKPVFTRHYDFFYDRFAPLRIFMYNMTLKDMRKLCKCNYCSLKRNRTYEHTFFFESVLHRTIKKGYNREYDPEKADLFYVPIYLGLFNMARKKCDLDNRIFPMIRKEGDYFDRYNKVDHILVQMLFSHGNVPLTPVHQATVATQTTIGDIIWDLSVNRPREMWRYTIMPYNSNFYRRPTEQKRWITAFLIGQFNIQAFDRRAKAIRCAVKKILRKMKNTVIIETRRKHANLSAGLFNIEEYMAHTEFCPVPHGDGPASKRLFDSIRTGCIPIVLTDEIRFPFEATFANYENVVAHIPSWQPYHIRSAISIINNDRKRRMRNAQRDIDRILYVDYDTENIKGGNMWAWMWMQYFKSATVSASKRRGLLKSKYL